MKHFHFKESNLFCEDVRLDEVSEKFHTPLYVYSYNALQQNIDEYKKAFCKTHTMICYAVKANSNLSVLKVFAQSDIGADVVSGGELYRCLKAGIVAKNIVFSGVGKTESEIEYALKEKIQMINIESSAELDLIERISKKLDCKASIAFRLNPDVKMKTHHYITTGARHSKFGLVYKDILPLVVRAAQSPWLEVMGISFHIGSQITTMKPFINALKKAKKLIHELAKVNIIIPCLNIGGGLGVTYVSELPPAPEEYARVLMPLLRDLKVKLILEPGRSLVANTGILLTKVLRIKHMGRKRFIVVDAGMNDFIRPALYGAKHSVERVQLPLASERFSCLKKADVVGPICESGDFMAKDCYIGDVQEGDLLCIRSVGAYGFCMSSQYNSRPKPAEVMIHKDQVYLIRKRETLEDLVCLELENNLKLDFKA